MRIRYITDFTKFNDKDLVLALGFFDGIHLWHKKVLEKCIEIAKFNNKKSAVLTFSSSIKQFISSSKIEYLSSNSDKIECFDKIGFDEVIFIELSKEFIELKYTEFYKLFLENQFHIICGFDYSFGYKGEGNIDYLKSMLNDRITIIPKYEIDGEKVGSFRIISFIKSGDIVNANKYLGYDYKIDGKLYKRNKYYALTTSSYYIPKNGIYTLRFKSGDMEKEVLVKTKLLDSNNGLLLRVDNNEVFDYLIKESNHFDVYFTK